MLNNILIKYKKLIILTMTLIVLLLLGLLVHNILIFRLVNTNPNVDSVGTLTPFLKLNFNRNLTRKNIQINSPNGATDSFKISYKTIEIYLNYPLKESQLYTINVNDVTDTAGIKIKNIKLDFKPTIIPFNSLPADQQKTLVNNQDKYNQPGSNINYVNTEALINNGLSTTQLALLEKYFADFKPNAKIIKFVPNSIGVYSAPAPALAEYRFIVNIDGVNYNAIGTYTFLDNIILSLYNTQTGTQVFNSYNYTGSGG